MERNVFSLSMTEDDLRHLVRTEIEEALQSKNRTTYGVYLNPKELAEMLKCSLQTIYLKSSKNEIPGKRRIGGKVVFETESVMKWIDSGAIATNEETMRILRQHSRVTRTGERG